MKRNILLLGVVCTLFASKCKKDDSCNNVITVLNNTDSSIIISELFTDGSNNCVLSGEPILPNNYYTFDLLRSSCWEDRLSDGRIKEIYIVAPSNFNYEGLYPCDSIEYKNTVLRKYELSIEDLRATDFKVVYP